MIVKSKHDDHWKIRGIIEQAFEGSRFVMDLVVKNDNTQIDIYNVRLTQQKDYCGNHPEACPVTFFVKKHKRLNYLEGADWVDFNDRLNDALDVAQIECKVYSTICWVRRGRLRRTSYSSYYVGNFPQWVKRGEDVDYEDFTGRDDAPESFFPSGTPGLYTRKGATYECS